MIGRSAASTLPSALVPHVVSLHSEPGRMAVARAAALNEGSAMVSSNIPSAAANAIMKLVPAIWW
jgi:hypothetical protein